MFCASCGTEIPGSAAFCHNCGALVAPGAEAAPSQTLDETARYLSDHLGVDAGDLPGRVQAVEFGDHRASDADLEDLAALRRRVRRRLRERSGRLTALLALYGVRRRRRRETSLPVARRARPATRS